MPRKFCFEVKNLKLKLNFEFWVYGFLDLGFGFCRLVDPLDMPRYVCFEF